MIDLHSHTNNSPDAADTPEAMVLSAIDKGIDVYAITDHCEVNLFFPEGYYGGRKSAYETFDFGRSFVGSLRDSSMLKEKYADKIKILRGVELAGIPFDYGLADAIVKDKRLDFIIGSTHQVKGFDDFAFIDYGKERIPELMQTYFEEVLKVAKWGKFDVLAHLTYTLRYIEGGDTENKESGWRGAKVDMKPYEEIIREIFKTLITGGKGIEINTSGLRQKYGKTFPDLYYIKLFREMGGDIITAGSDSHNVNDIGRGIKEAEELAKAAGFPYFTYFENRKPIRVKI
ncbi:MAG: histidinol-phosphatase HisJ family protein [Ruminococcus sp.]|jgi:histidinol-phosphatase (PHP family)|nr:histidinol-phosphatase HisJ family protein [Ruminococcus sp.]